MAYLCAVKEGSQREGCGCVSQEEVSFELILGSFRMILQKDQEKLRVWETWLCLLNGTKMAAQCMKRVLASFTPEIAIAQWCTRIAE